MIRVRVMVRF